MKNLIIILLLFPLISLTQIDSKQHDQLILRGGILINSTGAPPIGPVDIVIEKNIITKVQLTAVLTTYLRTNHSVVLSSGSKTLLF